jgi:4-phytase/acid phosphatase
MKNAKVSALMAQVICAIVLASMQISAWAQGSNMSPMSVPSAGAQSTSSTRADNTRLLSAVILSRHGTRSLLKDSATLERETSNTWPAWDVPPGYLTNRGRKQMVDMGSYYRARFTREGLLTGNDAEDARHAYFHTNVIQRTIQTGCALAEGLFPSTTTTVHYLAPGQKDMLFYGSPLNEKLSEAAINGRIGNNISALVQTMRPQLQLVEKSLAKPGLFAGTMSSLRLAGTMSDNYVCEYCEGMPMNQVAFGRASFEDIQEMLKLLGMDFDLQCRTEYIARTMMSNMAGHIVATLERAAGNSNTTGAFGDADDRLFVIVGHDSTLSAVAGLFRLDWALPDTGRNLCPPGGALVFELRQEAGEQQKASGPRKFVRISYVAPTLQQLREDKLSAENPPSIAPIFVPEASLARPHFDCELATFVTCAKKQIDPDLVVPIQN